MKLHILSDLHIEFGDFEPLATDADVVVLAGDIGVGVEGLRWAEDCFPDTPVIYVPGNHEFYHHDIALIDELKSAAPDPIHLLSDGEVEIGGVRFLGSVLWTDFALFGEGERFFATQCARQGMNDFAIIQNGGRRFTPEDAVKLHQTSRIWLESRMREPFAGKTVVVTHHAPSSHSVPQRYARDLLAPAFASNLEALMGGDRAALWVHGHTHDSFDYEISGTRVVCNPRGYAPSALNSDFRPDWVVEI
ncbi:MAG: metallophosphoesterase family protein [Candidatus Thiodiazotropha sp. (ex Dulcina madagascariensis)]|nr:metallophosphoesterase family protein [Candidatus Thiodiazotropha sp. (ex Dulcina madagascariensis)]